MLNSKKVVIDFSIESIASIAKDFRNIDFDDMTTTKLCFLDNDLLTMTSTESIFNRSKRVTILSMTFSYSQIKFMTFFNSERFRQTLCFES